MKKLTTVTERVYKPLPRWFEPAAVVAMLVMACVEYAHDQVMWSVIFGVAGALFGGSLLAQRFSRVREEDE